VFSVDKMLTLIRVQVHVGTEHLGGGCGGKVGTALDPDLHSVILERHQRDLVQSSLKKNGIMK